MSWRLGEPTPPMPAATRARLRRRFQRDLERKYPGYRFTIVPAEDDDQAAGNEEVAADEVES